MNTHPDFEELLRLFEEQAVDYMIVGGGMRLRGTDTRVLQKTWTYFFLPPPIMFAVFAGPLPRSVSPKRI